jgi:hypothetical protein
MVDGVAPIGEVIGRMQRGQRVSPGAGGSASLAAASRRRELDLLELEGGVTAAAANARRIADTHRRELDRLERSN